MIRFSIHKCFMGFVIEYMIYWGIVCKDNIETIGEYKLKIQQRIFVNFFLQHVCPRLTTHCKCSLFDEYCLFMRILAFILNTSNIWWATYIEFIIR
jgi:hypothetical protein